ncbi:hypothetical protein [Kitasatospora mediocidica]|uniref:hypothetical protein n=1 Tax=Kitasatospora mediocidica TaxID=58352 RepID=UPI00055BA5AF|nr:hypothetical protein [Kitasatospora mediocidica]
MRADGHDEASGSWEAAWSGGGRAVHLGNAADFNAQFTPGDRNAHGPLGRRDQGHHYACLAPFYSPHPAAVLLPRHLDGAWMDLLSSQLDWGKVELHSGIAEQSWFDEALAARPALLERLRATGLPLLPWGRTAGVDRLTGRADDGVLAAVRRFESKAAALDLFREVARDHPDIPVRIQRRVDSPRRLARLVAEAARAGRTLVLKSEYGVGGLGTVVVMPSEVARAGGARALVRGLLADGELERGGDVLVEPYVTAPGRPRDLTFDAVVARDGSVHPVGVAVMRVAGTGYRGATVGPGVLPDGLALRAARFGCDVGRALAGHGYRGWFDIDFINAGQGRLAPAEANLRLTGPAVAFMLRARLDAVRGPGHLVRTLDEVPLGARVPQEALFEHTRRLVRLCEPLGATLLPTLPSTGFEPYPALGVAIAARSTVVLDAAEALVRAASAQLGEMFADIAPD